MIQYNYSFIELPNDHATVEIHVRKVYARYSIAINHVKVSEKFIYLVYFNNTITYLICSIRYSTQIDISIMQFILICLY